MTREYLVGETRDGEPVAVMAQRRSLLLNILNARRIMHRPVLNLRGCSSEEGKPFHYRFPASFPVRTLYCADATFADTGRQQAFENARAELMVGPRMNAIMESGRELDNLLVQEEAAA